MIRPTSTGIPCPQKETTCGLNTIRKIHRTNQADSGKDDVQLIKIGRRVN